MATDEPASLQPQNPVSMNPSIRLPASLLVAATLAFGLVASAHAEESNGTIKFSDATKPGTLKIKVAHGGISIKGDDVAEVTVKSDAKPITEKPRKDGLRVLTAASSYTLNEKDNVITLDAASEGWAGAPSDFRITVPRKTMVVISSSFGGDISCAGVSGDLDIKCLSGDVTLTDVTGGALVEMMNGEIHATVRELHDGKPLSFTSMNGEVVIRVPADAKANVRLRTQNGSILTDFDDKALVTKTENTARGTSRRSIRSPRPPAAPAAPGAAPAAAPSPAPAPAENSLLEEKDREEIRAAVRESVRAGTEAAREAMTIAREAMQAAHEGMAEAGVSVRMPNLPPIPPVTGGKLVTGTLNGGGPEISVVTMNGDVTLRQLEAKK